MRRRQPPRRSARATLSRLSAGPGIRLRARSLPAVVVDAITRQAATLINPSPAFFNVRRPSWPSSSPRTASSTTFSSAAPAPKLTKARSNWRASGGRSTATAPTRSRLRQRLHGRTLATMAASGKPGWIRGQRPFSAATVPCPGADQPAQVAADHVERSARHTFWQAELRGRHPRPLLNTNWRWRPALLFISRNDIAGHLTGRGGARRSPPGGEDQLSGDDGSRGNGYRGWPGGHCRPLPRRLSSNAA